MKEGILRRIIVPLLCIGLMTLGSVQVQAEEANTSEGWKFAAGVYLWGADIGGNTASSSAIDVSFDDIFDNLNGAFMGTFEARKDKWLVLTDLIYMDISADDNAKVTIPIGPINIDVKGEANIDLKATMFELAGGYNLIAEGRSRLDLIGGARYMDLDMDASVKLTGPIASRPIKISESGHVWDGIVGVKGNYNLNPRWSFPYYADIGTGQSDFTWQAAAGVSFHAAKWIDVALVYRHLEWDVGGDFVDDLNISGLALGAIIRF
jgi:hypothetical protein